MKKNLLIMLAALSSGTAWAVDFTDTARVISSRAIFERVSEPKQECWNETVSSSGVVTKSAPEERSLGGALLGGLIGGVVGSQIGQGNGNTVATGVGAITGAIIGDRVSNQDATQTQQVTRVPQTREERHCRQIENYRDVIRGYDVTYSYNGREATTRMSAQPGSTVRVGVSVLNDTNPGNARDNRNYDGMEQHGKKHSHDEDNSDW